MGHKIAYEIHANDHKTIRDKDLSSKCKIYTTKQFPSSFNIYNQIEVKFYPIVLQSGDENNLHETTVNQAFFINEDSDPILVKP